MNMKKSPPKQKTSPLRQKAEKKPKQETDRLRDLSDVNMKHLIHELSTHQLELEIKNEELRRAQVELDVSHRKYADLYDFAPVGYFTFDKSGHILETNLAVANMLGVNKGMLVNKHFSLFLDGIKDRRAFSAHLMEVLKRQTKWTSELRLNRKDGKKFNAELQSIPAEDNNGEITLIRTAVSDITERKRTEEALVRSKSEFEAIFKSISDAAVYLDMQRKVVMVNPAVTEIFGYTLEELRGRSLDILYANKNLFEKIGQKIHRSDVQSDRKIYEIKYMRKDGSVFVAETLSNQVRGPLGNIIGFVDIHRDVSERKQSEEALAKLASIPLLNPNPVIEADLGGTIKFMNPAAEKSFPDLRTTGAQHPLFQGLESIAAVSSKDGELHSHVRDIKTGNEWYEQAIYFVQGTGVVRFYCRNITKRTKVWDALRRSEAILAHAGKMARLGAWDIQTLNRDDIHVNPLHWSDETYRIFGYEPGQVEVTTDLFFERVHPEDRQKILDAVDKAVVRKEPYSIEHRVIRSDGAEIMVAEYAEIIFNEQGQPDEVLGAVQDITELKQAEKALKIARDELELRVQERTTEVMEQSRLLESFFRHTQTCLVFLDREFNFLRVNEAYARACDRKVSDFDGRNHFVDYPSEELKGRFQRVVDTKEPYSAFGRPFTFPDHPEWGTTYWDLAVAPLLDSKGEVELLIFSLLDVTERKRAEEDRTRLASAVDSAADAVVITDALGIVQYINPAFERMTGYTRNEIIWRDVHFLDSGKHDEAFYREFRETLASNGVWSGRLINKKKDGSFYFEDCTCTPVKDPSGKIINYVYIKRDATERLKLESIADAVNTMDNIGYIFSGVRHEIGNPINTAKMILSVLRHKLEENSTVTIREYIDRTLAEISRVEYHLKTLKNFNLYETLELTNVNIADFINRFLSLVGQDFEKKGISIMVKVEQDVGSVYADPRALQQALLNVMTNASDALEGREDPAIDITISKLDDHVRIQIHDNGSGISEEDQKTLFRPFVTSKKQGTGLGLVLVKKMLTKMNGGVMITSRPDAGTTVDIMIPEGRNDIYEQENTSDH